MPFRGGVSSSRVVWRLPVAWGPHVANALLSGRGHPPVTRCSRRLATSGGKPGGGAPLSPPAAASARHCSGPSPPAPRSHPDAAPQHRFRLLACCPLGEAPRVQEAPPRHAALPRHRPQPAAPQAGATAPNARATPAPPGPPRVGTHPTPRPRPGPPAHLPVPCFGEALLAGPVAAVLRRRRSARSAPPSRRCCTARPPKNALPTHPAPCRPLPGRCRNGRPCALLASGAGPQGPPRRVPCRPLGTQALVRGVSPPHTTPQPTRQRRALPQPSPLQWAASYPQFLLWRLLGYAEDLQIPIAASRATR
jgi:hypothetical protein